MGSIFIPLRINGLSVDAVVDTAAEVTVISTYIWHQLKHAPAMVERVVLKGAAENSRMEALVVPGMRIGIGSQTHKWTVHVAPISDAFILGLDFMKRKGCIVDMTKDSFRIGGESLISSLRRNSSGEDFHLARLITNKKVVLPPNTEKWIRVALAPERDKNFVVHPESDNRGLLVPHCVISGAKEVEIRLRNPTGKYTTLKKGHLLGTAVELDKVLREPVQGSQNSQGGPTVDGGNDATGGLVCHHRRMTIPKVSFAD